MQLVAYRKISFISWHSHRFCVHHFRTYNPTYKCFHQYTMFSLMLHCMFSYNVFVQTVVHIRTVHKSGKIQNQPIFTLKDFVFYTLHMMHVPINILVMQMPRSLLHYILFQAFKFGFHIFTAHMVSVKRFHPLNLLPVYCVNVQNSSCI